MTLIENIQAALLREKLEGWLFFDHHRRDPLAYSILRLSGSAMATRRWYYFVPATGEPWKLVHRIEGAVLDSLPGGKESYSSWQEQQGKLKALLGASSRIAMQYSPNCAIPYVSLVDAGTLELVRQTGVQVVSSADLVQEFEARWTESQYGQHVAAGKLVDEVRRKAFHFVGERIAIGEAVTEYEVQQFIRQRFAEAGLFTDHGPIVAVNANASDPHYEPGPRRSSRIEAGDLVLIDLWAKLNEVDAVYYDVTWTGFCGEVVPHAIQNVFEIVRDARKNASRFVLEGIESGRTIRGFESTIGLGLS